MGINNVSYAATIQEIISSRDEILCPGEAIAVPEEFGLEERGKIWEFMKNYKRVVSLRK